MLSAYDDMTREEIAEELRAQRACSDLLLEMNRMSLSSEQEIADFALEEMLRLTGSQIGFLGFLTTDERTMRVHAWSSNAVEACRVHEKPLTFDIVDSGIWGEAVCRRSPVVINDYAAPHPAKRGVPEGHVKLRRFMEVPVMEGDRVVAVAAVANKSAPYDPVDVRMLTLFCESMWSHLLRIRAERRSREEERKLARLIDTSVDWVWEVDEGGVYTHVSPNVRDIMGYGEADVLGRTPFDFMEAAEAERVGDRFRDLAQRGERITGLEHTMLHRDGREIVFEANAVLLFGEDGKQHGYFGTCRDITRRVRAEEELKKREEVLRAVFEQAPCAVLLLDGDTAEPVEFNAKAHRMLGYSRDEFRLLRLSDIEAVESREEVDRHMDQVIREGPQTFETRHRTRDGRLLDVLVNTSTVSLQGGTCFVSLWMDITAQKVAEEERRLNEARLEALLRLNEMQDAGPDELAAFALEQSERLTGSGIGFINFLSEDEKYVTRAVYTQGTLAQCTLPKETAAFRISGCGLWSEAYRQRQPVVMNDYTEEHAAKVGFPGGHPGLRRFVSIPVFDEGRVVAVAALGNKKKDYDAGDVRQFRLFMEGLWQLLKRRQAEEALRETEERQRQIIENSSAGYFFVDREGYYQQVNSAWLRLHRYESGEEVIGRHYSLTQVEDDLPHAAANVEALLDGREIISGEFSRRCRDGSLGYHTFSARPVKQDGDIIGLEGFLIDTTDHRHAREALERSEETYRALVEGLPDVVMRFDREGRHLFVSEAVERVVDIPAARFEGRTHRELGFPEDQCRYWENAIRRVFDSGMPYADEFSFEGKNGPALFDWRLLPERDSEGRVQSVVSISRNITREHRARQDYETLFREMLNGFALHEIICDGEGRPVDYRFLAVNPAFERLTGLLAEDLVGRTVLEVLPDTEARWIETYGRVALTGKPVRFEEYSGALEKHFTVMAFQPAPHRFACIFEDITERKIAEETRKRLEDRLRQAHKMEAIGTLAGGIAHDFNNILGIIVGNTELAMFDLPEWSPAQESLQEIRGASLRARDLVTQILLFARQKEHTITTIRPEPVARESLRMIRASIPATVEIQVVVEDGLPSILADPSQFQQIILNLCTNASQVMEKRGGRLDVVLGSACLEAPLDTVTGEIPKGRYLRLEVRDTGPGIPRETLERIFDPFFTTKGVGEGTGLGLAVVHGIVEDRSGGITVESTEEQGTVFTVYLPAYKDEAALKEEQERPRLPRGTERILFVDDEPMVRKLGMRMLERLGYEVETQANGVDALACFRKDSGRFDLVITDMTMPGMTGNRLAREILAVRPEMPVILCTGYSSQISEEEAREIGISAFVMKPLTSEEMAGKVRRVLDGSRNEAGVDRRPPPGE